MVKKEFMEFVEFGSSGCWTYKVKLYKLYKVNYQAINDLAFTFAGLEVYVSGEP